ncbi:thiolase family protein [Aeromicrobium sp.]|uniref:thiolase family protein n=1 Tax=Aeromicrobium sp. TaxID=1871063 RepID=UPI00198DFABF|nr:thiolase family protein [Aeromicrobium sp.]MBC7630715.1 thiolase family protein [Aeromicrobium sp.]
MSGVSIVGIGMHAFGRTDGVSGQTQGVIAAKRAMADAGITWPDVQFAAGGSDSAGNPDTMVSRLGLTGVPFVNVKNGCAAGGSSLAVATAMIKSGAADVAMAIGFDKHPRGAFNENPADWGLPSWYGETGLMLTTQFFAAKIQRYMHDYGISSATLAKVARKAFANGALNENAWRRTPMSEEEIAGSRMINEPLTQFMFCSPGEGAVALVLCRSDLAHRYASTPVQLRAVSFLTRKYGSFEVFSPHLAAERVAGPTVDASAAVFEEAGIGPDEVDIAQIQDTESGAEIMHMAETGLCKHGEQESMIAEGQTEIGGALPINTDGGCLANGEPIGASGLRQVYENVVQLRGDAGGRQAPGSPKVAFTHVYGAPGVSACTVLTR